jgi:hypothetical protein
VHTISADDHISLKLGAVRKHDSRIRRVESLYTTCQVKLRSRSFTIGINRHLSQSSVQVRSMDEMPWMRPELLAHLLCWDVVFDLAVVREVLDDICALDAADVFGHETHSSEEAIAVGSQVNGSSSFLRELGLFEDVDLVTLLSQCDCC